MCQCVAIFVYRYALSRKSIRVIPDFIGICEVMLVMIQHDRYDLPAVNLPCALNGNIFRPNNQHKNIIHVNLYDVIVA
jgi:hypothetical protein